MNKKEIELIEKEIEDNLKAGECGLASNNEKFQWTNTANAMKKMLEENKKLKDNWNKLKEKLINDINYWEEQEKEWIKLGFMKFGGEANSKIIFKKVLDKMQELEGGDSNDSN